MNIATARKLVKQHSFTRIELYEMMVEALDTYPDSFWKKPYTPNPFMDMGYFFNDCVEFLSYKKGINDNEVPKDIFTIRILQCVGEFSKVKLPKKKKHNPEITMSAIPRL